MKKQKLAKPAVNGLIGLFGHTLGPDPIDHNHQIIKLRFQITGQRSSDIYSVQSFLDGRPTETKLMHESVLLSDKTNLYATVELWLAAAEKNNEDKRQRREQAIARKVINE